MTLCLLLSLLIHAGAVGPLVCRLSQADAGRRATQARRQTQPKQRALQIVKAQPQPTQFVKTDPDQEEMEPETADFIGKRNTSESAAEYAPDRYDDKPVPTQNGEDDKQELVTFDQRRQEGDLADEGGITTGGKSMAENTTTKSTDDPAAAPTEPREADNESPPAEGTAAVTPPPIEDEGAILIHNVLDEQEDTTPIKVDMAVTPTETRPSATQKVFYDPTLAEHMQPTRGFRTRERRTRSTGRFIIGRKPSLNVAATPRGRYEEEIYRRIAYFWYRACDDHRGDIIPGSVVISLRINRSGLLSNMELVRRRGASMSQQAFTFGAIRQASLPPMPPNVREEVVGDVLELIFQFNFD